MKAVAKLLPDRKRLHLQHGPIDLIIAVSGAVDEVNLAYKQAWIRFQDILSELVKELEVLRSPVCDDPVVPKGPVARNMHIEAITFGNNVFLTPMSAVAGAVADEILYYLLDERIVHKAYVNNGGDIALWLSPGAKFSGGLVSIPEELSLKGMFDITDASGIRGIATSGWRGRSHSLGIADSVTVFAANAARADVAATLIANSVDLPGHSKIYRSPAKTLDPDSDLGERLVTTNVKPLSMAEVDEALLPGVAMAEQLLKHNLVAAVVLKLQDQVRFAGNFGSGGYRGCHSVVGYNSGEQKETFVHA